MYLIYRDGAELFSGDEALSFKTFLRKSPLGACHGPTPKKMDSSC
jgi:hypothetical protein